MMLYNDWRDRHFSIIDAFLQYLNKQTDGYILKGGTSLLYCYNLDRFSEDIDLDARTNKSIKKIIDSFCISTDCKYRIAKDTDTVKRFMINYGNDAKPLKIEISYRRKYIDENEVTKINGINVYNINEICLMKANAYSGRDKIRDLYDICFLCNNYWNYLSEYVKKTVRIAIEYKGLEQFEYIIKDQKDELIDNKKLEYDFLRMYEKLEILSENSNHKDNLLTEENEEEYDDFAPDCL